MPPFLMCFHGLVLNETQGTQGEMNLYLIIYGVRHEDLWGSGGTGSPFLLSAVDTVQWSLSCPKRFTDTETYSCNHWIRVGLGVNLDTVHCRRTLVFGKNRLSRSSCSPSLYWTSVIFSAWSSYSVGFFGQRSALFPLTFGSKWCIAVW
jgi:hypothetical protein